MQNVKVTWTRWYFSTIFEKSIFIKRLVCNFAFSNQVISVSNHFYIKSILGSNFKFHYSIYWKLPYSPGQSDCRVVEQRSGEIKDCIFPFTYNDQKRHGCINDEQESGKYWCPTDPDTDDISDNDIRCGQLFLSDNSWDIWNINLNLYSEDSSINVGWTGDRFWFSVALKQNCKQIYHLSLFCC